MLNYVINKIQNLKTSTNGDSSQIQNLKSSGYAKHSLSIIRDNTLSNTSKVIYLALCSYAGSKDIAYPTIKRLIGELNISRTKFYRHIQALKKREYITIKQSSKDGKYSSNIYTINDDVPRATSNSLQNPALYGRHDNAIIKDKTLSDASKVIYCLLCGYAGNKNTAYPSVNRILDELGISNYKFYKHLEPLKERGYIKVTRNFKDGKYSSNVYTINDSVPRNSLESPQNLSKPKNTNKPRINTYTPLAKIEVSNNIHTENLGSNQKIDDNKDSYILDNNMQKKLLTPSRLQKEILDSIKATKLRIMVLLSDTNNTHIVKMMDKPKSLLETNEYRVLDGEIKFRERIEQHAQNFQILSELEQYEKQVQAKISSAENEYPKNEYTQKLETKKDLNLLKEKVLKDNFYKSKSMSKSYGYTQNQKENHIKNNNLNGQDQIENDIKTMARYAERIKENIDYTSLMITHKSEKGVIDDMLDIIVDALMSKSSTIRVHQENKSKAIVEKVLLKLGYSHIVHAINQFNSVTHPIKHIHAYLLTVLYSSGVESNAHCTNWYNSTR